MTSAWSITASANPPRAAFTDFPLGHTSGRPDRPDEQVDLIRDTLACFASIDDPGTIVPLDYEWGEEWKDGARALQDHRTERRATPQYQTADDRAAAVARFGQTLACEVCLPAGVPVR